MKDFAKRLAAVLLALPLLFLLYSCSDDGKTPAPTDADTGVNWTPIDGTEETAAYVTERESTGETETETQASSDGDTAPLALMYHLVLDEPYSALEDLFVRPSELRGHIEALLEKGYRFIFADEYNYYADKTVIMSFDDGYLDNYTEVFPIIKEYNVKITIFMISNYVGCPDYMTEDMLKEMSASGLVSVQSHTATHPDLTTQSEESLRTEFQNSQDAIEAITGRKVTALCYPAGAYNELVTSVAADYFRVAYTTESRISTAGYPLLELPRLRVNRGFSKDYFMSIIP